MSSETNKKRLQRVTRVKEEEEEEEESDKLEMEHKNKKTKLREDDNSFSPAALFFNNMNEASVLCLNYRRNRLDKKLYDSIPSFLKQEDFYSHYVKQETKKESRKWKKQWKREWEKKWKKTMKFVDELIYQLNIICEQKESELVYQLKKKSHDYRCEEDEDDNDTLVSDPEYQSFLEIHKSVSLRNIRVSLLLSLSFLYSVHLFIESQSIYSKDDCYFSIPSVCANIIQKFISSITFYLNSCYLFPLEMIKSFKQKNQPQGNICFMMNLRVVITGFNTEKKEIECILKRELVVISKREMWKKDFQNFEFHNFVKKSITEIKETIKSDSEEEEQIKDTETLETNMEHFYFSFSLLPYIQFYSTLTSQNDLTCLLSHLMGESKLSTSINGNVVTLPFFSFQNQFYRILPISRCTVDYFSNLYDLQEDCNQARFFYKDQVQGKIRDFFYIEDIQFIDEREIKKEEFLTQRMMEDIDYEDFNKQHI